MKTKEKRYYWLKLHSDFFKQKEMKKLRKIAGGDTFTIIYLKMQLLSLRNEGVILFENVEDSIEEELALDLDESVDDVQMTMLFLKKHGLIEEVSTDEFLLPKAAQCMGSEAASAERVRRHREKKEALQCNDSALQSDTDVTKCNTEKEIEIEKESEKDKDILPGAETAPGRNPSKKPNGAMTELPAAECAVIELPLNDGTMYAVFQSSIDRWAELYPAVDVMQQLRAMVGWSEANPAKKKTRRGVNKFINYWLSKEQDRGVGKHGSYQQRDPTASVPAGDTGSHKLKYGTTLE